MEESLSGGTTNLLRMARSGCQSSVSFVALALGDQTFATAMYPPTPDEASLTADEVDDLVRQLWLDPGLAQGRALVRTVRMGGRRLGPTRRLSTAVVPLGAGVNGRPLGILGVADAEAKSFGLPELELLTRIAQRLASYVQARQEVRLQLSGATAVHRTTPSSAAPTAEREKPPSGASSSEPWWTVEPSAPLRSTGVSRPAVGSRPLPPFPPPAGIVGLGPAAGRSTGHADAGSTVAGPDAGLGLPRPAATEGEVRVNGGALSRPESRGAAPRRRATGEARLGSRDLATPVEMPGPGRPDTEEGTLRLLGGGNPSMGLVPLGTFIGRTGRLLGAGAAARGALAIVAIDVGSVTDPVTETVAAVAHALRGELRFDDPVARIGRLSFAVVAPLVPGAASAEVVEARLVDAVRTAVQGRPGAEVRAAYVVAELSSGQDADELLRSAVVKLRAG